MAGMSLRTRITLIVALVALGSSVAGYMIQRFFLYDQFVAIERQEAGEDLLRCTDAVSRETAVLAVYCGDWAAWDEPYEYITNGDPRWVVENITDESMVNARVDAIWLVATDGAIRHARIWDHEKRSAVTLPELPSDRFAPDHPLLKPRPLPSPVSGILRTSHGPMIVASRQVIKSDFTGPPVGWFICGRFLSPSLRARLAAQTHVSFKAWTADDPARDPASAGALAARDGSCQPTLREPWVKDDDPETLLVFGILDDLHGQPAVILRADVSREISRKGMASIRVGTVSAIVAGLGMLIVLLLLLGVTVVSPLRRLRDHAVRLGLNPELDTPSGIDRTDEIGTLAGSFDDMVGRLRESQDRLADAARRAGIADVTRGMLHNVGNLLTSMNVSVLRISDTHRRSRADGVLRAADLISEHSGDLARFLTEDPRGQKLPAYLAQAAAAYRQERDEVAGDLEQLRSTVAHAVDIVAKQGEFASGPSSARPVELDAVVADALLLVGPAMLRHGVQIEREVQVGCPIVVDRTKFLQILVNLLVNAKEAMAGIDPGLRRLRIRASVVEERVRIRVEDTGCGIAADMLARVFESGFSTKGAGRGLGLHLSAVAATEMGGSLTASSEGPGRGATFTLDLPRGAPVAPSTPTQARSLAGSIR